SHGHVELERHAVDGGPGRDVARDVKSNHTAADGTAARAAHEKGGTGAVAQRTGVALIERVVLAGTDGEGRGYEAALQRFDLQRGMAAGRSRLGSSSFRPKLLLDSAHDLLFVQGPRCCSTVHVPGSWHAGQARTPPGSDRWSRRKYAFFGEGKQAP